MAFSVRRLSVRDGAMCRSQVVGIIDSVPGDDQVAENGGTSEWKKVNKFVETGDGRRVFGSDRVHFKLT